LNLGTGTLVNLRIFETSGEAGHAVARRVAEALRRTPDLVLGLPAGRTPIEAYAELRRLHASGAADFSRATAFLLDEFVDPEPPHPGTFRRFLNEHILSGINLDPARTHGLNGMASDAVAECDRYEDAIAAAGGLGLILLGIGANGHVGFNEPGERLLARTHRVTLLEATRRDNSALFGGDMARVPTEALSMGMGTILHAKAVVMLAIGERKGSAVQAMVNGPLTTRLPASLLQLHRHVEVYLDRAAASSL
jgi:glucosamine-6-phosphate deaminase